MDSENKYGTLQTQQALLVLLKEFDRYCQNQNIVYSLDSGTLLGAIRHGGFIPWDDDVDVIMDRANFEKFCSSDFSDANFIKERSLWIERVRLSPELVDKYKCPIIPTLDIFILDRVPQGRLQRFALFSLIRLLQGMMKSKPDYSKFSLLNRILLFVTYYLGRVISDQRKYKLYHQVATLSRNTPSPFSTCFFYPFSEIGCIFKSEALDKIESHQFEDGVFSIMSDYDSFLKELYGDYMTLPPVKDRKPSHISESGKHE